MTYTYTHSTTDKAVRADSLLTVVCALTAQHKSYDIHLAHLARPYGLMALVTAPQQAPVRSPWHAPRSKLPTTLIGVYVSHEQIRVHAFSGCLPSFTMWWTYIHCTCARTYIHFACVNVYVHVYWMCLYIHHERNKIMPPVAFSCMCVCVCVRARFCIGFLTVKVGKAWYCNGPARLVLVHLHACVHVLALFFVFF